MKKRIITVLLPVLVIGCSGLMDLENNTSESNATNGKKTTLLTRSDVTVNYMGHKYSITDGPLSIEKARALFSDTSLEATHRALRILPSNMEQLHRLEADESLIISYHPLEYVLIPESFDNAPAPEQEMDPVYEECGTVVAMEDLRTVSPVYVLWPVSHPLPQGVNYELLYEVYMPEAEPSRLIPDPYIEPPHAAGHLRCYDNRLASYKPLKHVQLQYIDVFSSTRTAYTDTSGYFYLSFADIDYPVTVKLRNDKFVVRDSTTSNVKSFSFSPRDYVLPFPGNENPVFVNGCNVQFPANFFWDTYKAAEYYFYGDNDLLNIVPIYDTLGVSIDIHAINSSAPNNILGCFSYSTNNSFSPYINIFNPYSNYSGASSKIFGTVNHELAHATNYTLGASYMYATDDMIVESFASLMGWYNVSQYYSSYVGTSHSLVHSICTQGRQNWTQSSTTLIYTPIFIDLYDDYNQHTTNSSYNNDPISGVPISFIANSALGPQSFQSVHNLLQSGVGSYYTSSEFSTFISPYSIFLP